jgi:hypothetical protein
MSSGIDDDFFGVWGNSSSDIFAVGENGTIAHYDGRSWTSVSSPTSHWLYGVWGSSSNDVFAVGENGTILHYDGIRWSRMDSGTNNCFDGVWGSSGNDVFAVGEGGTILHYPPSSPLSIRKDVAPAGPIPYQSMVIYTAVLSNNDTADASGACFTDTLPSQVDFFQWIKKPNGANVSNDQITWSGTVTAGQAITFTFIANHVGLYGDSVTNIAQYSHASGRGSDEATFIVQAGSNVFLPLVINGWTP